MSLSAQNLPRCLSQIPKHCYYILMWPHLTLYFLIYYSILTSFSISFSCFQTLPHIPLALFQIHVFFHRLLLHAYVCTYVSLNVTVSIYMLLLSIQDCETMSPSDVRQYTHKDSATLLSKHELNKVNRHAKIDVKDHEAPILHREL